MAAPVQAEAQPTAAAVVAELSQPSRRAIPGAPTQTSDMPASATMSAEAVIQAVPESSVKASDRQDDAIATDAIPQAAEAVPPELVAQPQVQAVTSSPLPAAADPATPAVAAATTRPAASPTASVFAQPLAKPGDSAPTYQTAAKQAGPAPADDKSEAVAPQAAAATSAPADSLPAMAREAALRPLDPVVRSEPVRDLPAPNPVEKAVASQVSRAVVRHLPDGGERLVVRLTPPELGTVRVEFTSRDGTLSARLVAEDEGVRQALDRALPMIKGDLRSEHPTLDIAVSSGRDDAGRWNADRGQQQAQQSQQDGQQRRREGDPAFQLDGQDSSNEPLPERVAPALGGRASIRGVDAFA